jgi:hypothetical protein
MAKRATSVFAAAPIIQGKRDGSGTPDKLESPFTSIIGGFCNTLDNNQGTIVFWITPEWNGNDGIAHRIYSGNDVGNIVITKRDTNDLLFRNYNSTPGLSIDVTGWVAGNRYCVVCRWDSKNTIDGTNYMCISVNDVHTFGGTVPFVPSVPAQIVIGATWNPVASADSIIEGLTIYRRVLYDGTYGVDVGNGDEVNLISAGVDPTTVTGSWDVCFCLPTNATAGALVTGNGEAWSHPHSSNLIPPVDGFMADTAWNNWTVIGFIYANTVLATADKIFGWGYQVGSDDDIISGYKYTLSSLTPGSDYVIRAIAHALSLTAQPILVVYDETNAVVIKTVTGTVAPTKAHPDVLMCSFELPTIARGAVADCVSISIQLHDGDSNGIVAWHQVELYTNLLDNPSFDTGAVADPWIPYGWAANPMVAGDSSQGAVVHSGGASFQLNAGMAAWNAVIQGSAVAVGKFVSMGYWSKRAVADTAASTYYLYDAKWQASLAAGILLADNNSLSWTLKMGVGRTKNVSSGNYIGAHSSALAQVRYLDDAFMLALDDVSLTVTPASAANSVESGGIRVDGLDLAIQPIPAGRLFAQSGWIRWRWIPRHDIAKWWNFGNYPRLIHVMGDANNLFLLDQFPGVTSIRLRAMCNGIISAGVTWDATGYFVAGGNYLFEVKYYPNGIYLYVDNILRIANITPINFVVPLVDFYAHGWSTQETDAVILAP